MSTLKANSYQHVDRASPSIIINSDGSVSISSTVTYEDVTSVDAVGVITGRSNADLQNRVNVGSGVSIKAGGLNVTAGISTFGDDVVFTGAAANVTWDKSTDDLIFNDNAKAIFGTGNDLEIFHDSDSSYINHVTSGTDLVIDAKSPGDDLILRAADDVNIRVQGNENAIYCLGNGPVQLYHDATLRLVTTTSGISISDDLNVAGILTVSDYIQHLGDTNTAIRFPAADTITAETAGSERLRIDSSGRLLLGTTTEGHTSADDLTIATSGHTGITLRSGTSHAGSIYFSDATSGGDEYNGYIIYDQTDDHMRFGTNENDRLRITAAGLVGIGSDNPDVKLTVCASSGDSYIRTIGGTNQGLLMSNSAGTLIGAFASGGALGGGVSDIGLRAESGNNILFSHGTTERARIDSSGRVMIGRTSAYASTDADNLIVGNESTNEHQGITILSHTSKYGTIYFGDGDNPSGHSRGTIYYDHANDMFSFGTAATTSRLTINSSGNAKFVGIVTASEFVPTAQPYGTKNIIVNGAMQVAQRGNSSTSSGYKTIDRMPSSIGNTGQGGTQTRQDLSSSASGPYAAGFRKYKRYQIDAAGNTNTNAYVEPLYYKVEAQDLAASGWDCESTSSYITISFWFRVSTNQTFYLNLRSEDGTKRMFTIPFTAGGNNTWTKIVQKVPGASGVQIDNNNEAGMSMYFAAYYGTSYTDNGTSTLTWNTHAGTTQCPDMSAAWITAGASTFDITGLQMEVGTEATPYQFLRYGPELALCQRYYAEIGGGNYGNYTINGGYTYNNGNNTASGINLAVPLRANPTIGNADNALHMYSQGNASTCGGVSYQNYDVNTNWVAMGLTNDSDLGGTNYAAAIANKNSQALTLEAEL